MATLSQIIKSPRNVKKKSSSKLEGNPQKKAVCLKIFTISPKNQIQLIDEKLGLI